MVLGVFLGVTAGYIGGRYEIIVMRLTDVQLTIPSILMALLVNGIAKSVISQSMHSEMAIYVLIFAIGISEWPQFARVSRASTWLRKIKNMCQPQELLDYQILLLCSNISCQIYLDLF